MLFVHDTHWVIGETEFDFEDSVRDEYAPALAKEGDARLMWFLHATHGAGEAYHIVTITAVRDGAAYDRLNERLRYGDLMDWRTKVDALRYSSHSTILRQLPWSPLSQLDIDSLPGLRSDSGDSAVLRQDTLTGPGLPGSLPTPSSASGDVLTCVAAFQPALAAGGSATILYRVAPGEVWTPALAADNGWGDWSGSLTPSLPDGVTSTSRMLRTTPWSPLG